MSFLDIDNRRAIVERRAVADRLASLRAGKKLEKAAAEVLCEALEAGRAEVIRRLEREPGNGRAAARATAFLHEQIVRLAYDFVCERLLRQQVEGLALIGLGGTGRGEMAPFSDLDLMFLTAKAPSAEQERTAEAVLHLLWDLKLKLGHSVRSTSELIALARRDMTIRTAFLEARWLWGDEKLFDATMRRFRKEIVSGSAAEFVAAKLTERDQRHVKMGDSRYVVEPNVKDGKAAFGTSTRSTGSANMCTASSGRRTWSERACSAPPSSAASTGRSASSGRCAATSTCWPGGRRSG
ncbi:MAG TPA: hypothetical protein VIK68_06210 [Sphingomicrobium sp.]